MADVRLLSPVIGQAMTLKVKKVLHHEKSLYQDVLIFESTDYGTDRKSVV